MKCNSTLYIIPSFDCNLSCSHCTIYKQTAKTNIDKLCENVINTNLDNYILFGGEPLMHLPYVEKLVQTNKITAISTNLLLLTDSIANFLKTNNVGIATSWNFSRFTNEQYVCWKQKMSILENNKSKCTVLITLTYDLIQNSPQDIYNKYIKDFYNPAIDEIKFEYLISENNTSKYYTDVDNWLCEMNEIWNIDAENSIVNQLKNRYIKNCHDVYTIFPDGTIVNGCPNAQYYKKYLFINDCVNCKYSQNCQPCILHKMCSMPKKLNAIINSKVNI